MPAVSSSEYNDIDPSISMGDVEAFLFLVLDLCGPVPFFAGDFSLFLCSQHLYGPLTILDLLKIRRGDGSAVELLSWWVSVAPAKLGMLPPPLFL